MQNDCMDCIGSIFADIATTADSRKLNTVTYDQWWLRSQSNNSGTETCFCNVTDGNIIWNRASNKFNVIPAFCIY